MTTDGGPEDASRRPGSVAQTRLRGGVSYVAVVRPGADKATLTVCSDAGAQAVRRAAGRSFE